MDFSSPLPSSGTQSDTPFRGGGSCSGCPLHTRWVQCSAGRLLPPILPIPWEWSPSPRPAGAPHPPGERDRALPRPWMGKLSQVLAARPIPSVPGVVWNLILHAQAPRSPAYPAGKGCGCLGLRKWERPGRSPALLLPQPHLPGPLNIPRAGQGPAARPQRGARAELRAGPASGPAACPQRGARPHDAAAAAAARRGPGRRGGAGG